MMMMMMRDTEQFFVSCENMLWTPNNPNSIKYIKIEFVVTQNTAIRLNISNENS